MYAVDVLQQVVRDTFGSLTDAGQVAQLCRDRAVQGFKSNPVSSPLVKLVREQVDFTVGYSMDSSSGSGRWVLVADRQISLPSPRVCEEFLRNFEAGEYPDLVAFGENNG